MMFGWGKAKEAVTTKEVMIHVVNVMVRALEREWRLGRENSELRRENSELKKKLSAHPGASSATEDTKGTKEEEGGGRRRK